MHLNTPNDIDDATESSTCGQGPKRPSDPPHALLKENADKRERWGGVA